MIYLGIACLALLFAILLLIASAILANRVPWFESPGFFTRIGAYLSTNVAETSENSPYPELHPRTYPHKPKTLFHHLKQAIQHLNWTILSSDLDAGEMHIEISTPLWKFKDDMWIRIEPIHERETKLMIRSASRIGQGDLGANIRHILDLYNALDHVQQ